MVSSLLGKSIMKPLRDGDNCMPKGIVLGGESWCSRDSFTTSHAYGPEPRITNRLITDPESTADRHIATILNTRLIMRQRQYRRGMILQRIASIYEIL